MATSNGKSSLWSRRNVLTLLITVVGLAAAAGAAATFIKPSISFWQVAWYVLQAEIGGMLVLFALGQMIPPLRQRLELPDPGGDEREQLIAMKAVRFTYTVLSTAGVIAFIAILTVEAFKPAVTISASNAVLYGLLLMQACNIGAVVYYSRRM